jgi:hypothetical protein
MLSAKQMKQEAARVARQAKQAIQKEAAARWRLGLSAHVAARWKSANERAVLCVIARETATRGACEMSCTELAHQAGVAVGVTGRVLTELTVWGKISQTVGPGGPKTRVARIEIIDREWLGCARLAYGENAAPTSQGS